jgi:eukaryotic-like serine/threonine-protein kinase
MADLTGKTLGPYRIINRIGRGGMATVYKAYHAAMDRHVAVKVLPEEYADDPGFRARFEREAKTVANLSHPHILPVFDYGEERGISFLVMPYIPTGTLKGYLAQEGKLPFNEAARIFTRLAEALDYAHQQGIIHRDIKPDNVLFDKGGNALITDFGLTRMVEGGGSLTGTGVIGTPAYMSPEQGQGMRLDHHSDIYSLGIILYEMVTGNVPFSADTPVAVIFKHVSDSLPPPRSLRQDLPEDAESAILKALSKNPNDRFDTCVAMAQAFAKAIAGESVAVEAKTAAKEEDKITAVGINADIPDISSDTQIVPSPKRGFPKWVFALIAVIIIATIAILASGVFAPDDEEPTQAAVVASDTVAPGATISATVESTVNPLAIAQATRDSEITLTAAREFILVQEQTAAAEAWTDTPTPTSTPSNTPTYTPSNTATPTNTPSNTPTNTPSKTSTSTSTPTDTPTLTPTDVPTLTPTNTATHTLHPTNTPLPTATNTLIPTRIPPTQTLTPTIANQLLFQDDFSGNYWSWETNNQSGVYSQIVGGSYVMNLNFTSDAFRYWIIAAGQPQWELAPVMNAPYEMTFEISNLSSSRNGVYSIAILFNVERNYSHFSRFYIDSNGTYRLLRWDDAVGEIQELASGWLSSDTPYLMDGRVHTIGLRVEANSYKVIIDDVVVVATSNFGPIYGTVGFGLVRGDLQTGEEIYAEFDNLMIYNIVR